jgi:hypothetical protein
MPFVASWYYPKTPVRTVAAYTEGVATTHFFWDGLGSYGRRLTGNPQLPNVPTVAIVGDSHIVQDSVPDSSTVGSFLEKMGRSEGRPINVYQYGWYDAAAPTYVAHASEVLARSAAATVVILMNYNDFGNVFANGALWQMKRQPDGTYLLKDVRPHRATGRLVEIRDMLTGSHLLLAVQRRALQIMGTMRRRNPAPAPKQSPDLIPEVALASVQTLRRAYGDRLVIVYTPFCGVRCTEQPEPAETALLTACSNERVPCASMRREMIDEASQNFRVSRGFHNTAPAAGHLNATGLELAARVIWREIHDRIPGGR